MIRFPSSINKPYQLLCRIVFGNLDVLEKLGFCFVAGDLHDFKNRGASEVEIGGKAAPGSMRGDHLPFFASDHGSLTAMCGLIFHGFRNNFITTHIGTFRGCPTAQANTKATPKRANYAIALVLNSKFLLN